MLKKPAVIQLKLVKSFFFPIILIGSILFGGLTGYFFGEEAQKLRSLGNIFLNLLLTAMVPLIFFSLSSAISRVGSLKKFGALFFYMIVVFIATGVVASVATMVMVKIFPLGQHVYIPLVAHEQNATVMLSNQLATMFSVPEFSKLFSHVPMFALIIFSILVGLAVSLLKEKRTVITKVLQSGEELIMRIFSLIMYCAPIGFFAYFAVLISELGPKLMTSYLHIAVLYYVFSLLYFVCVYTFFAYLAGKKKAVILFWKNVFLPLVTAIATCSSAASIPANLDATKRMHVPPEIYETTIPLGSIIHKDGSVIGGVIKIAFLFGIFHLNFSGVSVLLTALGVSLLVGTVMGAVPSGGMLGELLILSIYGFPPSALFIIAVISIIIDPLATMLNVTGNTVSSMMIARLIGGKNWLAENTSYRRVLP